MSNNRRYHKVQRKKKSRRRIMTWILLPFLIILISGATYATLLLEKAESKVEESYEEIRPEKIKPNPKNENISILFMGVDDSSSRNYNESARTDALVLATFNEKDKSIKMTSIPRDSYVYQPLRDTYDKITHAHAYDGVKGTLETVENLFEIDVDYYVKMNFYAFIDVVDALGGIEYDVPFNISEKDAEDRNNAIFIPKGQQELTGEQALALARTRKYDSDLERGKRQQEILKAIVKKGTTVGSIGKYGDVIDALGDNMKTNLSFDEMKSFLGYVSGTSLNIQSMDLKGEDDYMNRVYYYKIDEASLEEIKQTFKNHLSLNSQSVSDDSNTYATDNP
ncbi:LCP family protein [Cytobacillus sp. S13-E01]|uniref:LCP family protein n=1 Tax=Cytobacillus sp. S13-E01 TaxID=3031326 RepID=UPI0023D84021|nr:LCP family protein [Cytobacillus sp. S13-E01]MDF0726058.1 LCP family protein [Cytobacillus sp. S13-E01]